MQYSKESLFTDIGMALHNQHPVSISVVTNVFTVLVVGAANISHSCVL